MQVFCVEDCMFFVYKEMGRGGGGGDNLNIIVLHRILVLHYGSVLMLHIRVALLNMQKL